MPRTGRPDRLGQPFQFRLDPDMREAVEALAAETGQTTSAVLRAAVRRGLTGPRDAMREQARADRALGDARIVVRGLTVAIRRVVSRLPAAQRRLLLDEAVEDLT